MPDITLKLDADEAKVVRDHYYLSRYRTAAEAFGSAAGDVLDGEGIERLLAARGRLEAKEKEVEPFGWMEKCPPVEITADRDSLRQGLLESLESAGDMVDNTVHQHMEGRCDLTKVRKYADQVNDLLPIVERLEESW